MHDPATIGAVTLEAGWLWIAAIIGVVAATAGVLAAIYRIPLRRDDVDGLDGPPPPPRP